MLLFPVWYLLLPVGLMYRSLQNEKRVPMAA
jgi:hypothetical protein